MIRALYTASSGLVAQSVKQEIIANNIANAQTPGFKRDKAVASSFAQALESEIANTGLLRRRPPYPDSPSTTRIVAIESATDASQGPIRDTGYALDFAIEGAGAFQVSSRNGTEQTRAGNFHLDAEGELCTASGGKALGQNGTIRIPNGEWHVTEDGSVISKTGETIDKISIAGGDDNTRIRQHCIEEANVNIVREMVDMITNMRSFEANQKVVAAVDGTVERLINEVGKV